MSQNEKYYAVGL